MNKYTQREAQIEGDWMARAAKLRAKNRQPVVVKAINTLFSREPQTSSEDYQAAELMLAVVAAATRNTERNQKDEYYRVLNGNIHPSQVDARNISLYPSTQPDIKGVPRYESAVTITTTLP